MKNSMINSEETIFKIKMLVCFVDLLIDKYKRGIPSTAPPPPPWMKTFWISCIFSGKKTTKCWHPPWKVAGRYVWGILDPSPGFGDLG